MKRPQTFTVGGPLARRCATCGAGLGRWCLAGRARARHLHAARLHAAPEIVTVAVGDLVLVRLGGGAVLRLAQVLSAGEEMIRIRSWMPAAQAFASPRHTYRLTIERLALELDARTKLAREELERERLATLSPAPSAAGQSPAAPALDTIPSRDDSWSSRATTTARRNDEPAPKGW